MAFRFRHDLAASLDAKGRQTEKDVKPLNPRLKHLYSNPAALKDKGRQTMQPSDPPLHGHNP